MNDLAQKLKHACREAPEGTRVVTIHLFAIEHAKQLNGVNLKELASRAGISETYGTELNKGIRLADYVQITGKPK